MELTAEQIKQNWDTLMEYIGFYIEQPRKDKVLEFYKKFEDRLIMMPASSKVAYHNCFAGGYVDHVNRVIESSLKLSSVWKEMGITQNYTDEELVFSALNHDLGKMGNKDEVAYLPNPSQWHIDNRGELYTHNTKLTFMSVPDRSLYLLTQHGIEYSENEYLAIKLHDGVYDEANKPYLMSYMPETKPRTSLVHILHHADMLAARVEFEREWFPKFQNPLEVKPKKSYSKPGAKISTKIENSNINKTFLNILNEIN